MPIKLYQKSLANDGERRRLWKSTCKSCDLVSSLKNASAVQENLKLQREFCVHIKFIQAIIKVHVLWEVFSMTTHTQTHTV